MTKQRVALYGQPQKSVTVETDATVGAVLGVNLRNADGSLVTASQFSAAPPSAGGASVVYWSALLEIPANVQSVVSLATSGLVVRKSDGPWVTRTLQPVAGETTVTNGAGDAGDPAVGLANVTPGAVATLVAATFDAKGRRNNQRAASQADIDTALGYPAVQSVGDGAGMTVDATDPRNPIPNMGTPSSVTLVSTNSTSASSHAHAFAPGGSAAQYIDGTGALQTFPPPSGGTVTSVNLGASTGLTPSGGPVTGSGVLTYTLSANLIGWNGLATSAKENAITAGTTAQFWRGDKTWSNTIIGPINCGALGTLYIGSGFSGVGSSIAIGANALSFANLGTNNLAIGSQAMGYSTGGSQCVAIGADTLIRNTANFNTAIGYGVMAAAVMTGGENTSVGTVSSASINGGIRNAVVGYFGLNSCVSGSNNAALGALALRFNTASNNTAVGSNALTANTSGTPNVAVGVSALAANQTGANNTAVGPSALLLCTANNNTAVGANAGDAITTGQSNVAVGVNALGAMNTGSNSTVVGGGAAGSLTGANTITAFGARTAEAATSSSNSTVIGQNACLTTTVLLSCTIVGTSAMAGLGGDYTSAFGNAAMGALASGTNNSAFGFSSGGQQTGGANNCYFGSNSGRTAVTANANITGSNNTYIGNNTGPASTTQINYATTLGAEALALTSNTIVLGRAAFDFTVIGATGNSGGGGKLQVTGHINVLGAGNGLRVAEGANAKQGVATLVAGTVVVANTSVTANSRIHLTVQAPNGGTVGAPFVSSRINGTSFTINSTAGAADVSLVAYSIFEPGT